MLDPDYKTAKKLESNFDCLPLRSYKQDSPAYRSLDHRFQLHPLCSRRYDLDFYLFLTRLVIYLKGRHRYAEFRPPHTRLRSCGIFFVIKSEEPDYLQSKSQSSDQRCLFFEYAENENSADHLSHHQHLLL